MDTFSKGETIVAYAVRDIRDLTTGKHYVCLHGSEQGIFPDRPYVTVVDDEGKKLSCHQYRFKKLT